MSGRDFLILACLGIRGPSYCRHGAGWELSGMLGILSLLAASQQGDSSRSAEQGSQS